MRGFLWVPLGALVLWIAGCGGGGESNGFGSVAVSSSSGRVAISSEALTQSIANDKARDECDRSDCKVILQFEECGAASSALDAGGVRIFAAAEGGTAFDAQTAANSACTAQGGIGCATIPNIPAECN